MLWVYIAKLWDRVYVYVLVVTFWGLCDRVKAGYEGIERTSRFLQTNLLILTYSTVPQDRKEFNLLHVRPSINDQILIEHFCSTLRAAIFWLIILFDLFPCVFYFDIWVIENELPWVYRCGFVTEKNKLIIWELKLHNAHK